MQKKYYNTSILTKRLTAKVIKNYILTFLVLLLLLLFLLCPLLIKNTLKKQDEYSSFLATQYEQMITSVKNTTQALITDHELSVLLTGYAADSSVQNRSKIEQKLQSFVSSFSNVQYCLIETEEGTQFQSFSYADTKALNLCTSSEDYQRLRSLASSTCYSPISSEELFVNTSSGAPRYWMFTSRKLLIHNRPYIITAFYTVDDYLANSRTVLQNNFTDYIVTDRNLEVQYSSMASGGSKLQNRILSKVTDNDKPRYFSNGVLYYKRVISIGWDIITFSSWYVIFKEIFLILSVVLIFYFLPPVLFYINIIPTNQKFLQPLAALTKQIADYSAGQDLVLDIHTGDEIEQLGTSVNKMIIKINNQIEEIKRKEHENCITHYSLLATEIDPHFIYNTLSIINSMARQVGQNDIVEVNTALGKILRERFSTKTSVFETISSSLDTIQQYHTIMKYRYNNQVQISINAETIILREKIPKNLLIPIIENSYYHGLTNDTGNICGEIEVTIYSLSDEIVIEISDDGAGMSPERLQYIKNHHFQSPETDRAHIGFSNVYERLNYIYRNNFSIDLTSSLGFGTTVSITVPKYNETFEF